MADHNTTDGTDVTPSELVCRAAEAEAKQIAADVFRYDDPVDVWDFFDPPDLPLGLLPRFIERFAVTMAEIQGSSRAGFGLAGLVTATNVITKDIRVKVKRHDDWSEPMCLWGGLIGPPSAKKSPIISAILAPIRKIEAQAAKAHDEAMELHQQDVEIWENQPKNDRSPKPKEPARRRLLIEDTTVEALQEVQITTQSRLFCVRDELSAHFASLDRYSERSGGSNDAPYWLQAHNGGSFMSDRIKRGMGRYIECNLIGMLGGIQPDKIREVCQHSADDGTIQRIIPIMLGEARMDKDIPDDGASLHFKSLVIRLHKVGALHVEGGTVEHGALLRFSDAGQEVRNEFAAWLDSLKYIEVVDTKLATHIAKYGGMFARICGAIHIVDQVCAMNSDLNEGCIPNEISDTTARRAFRLIEKFLIPHAISFYRQVLAKSPKQSNIERVASSILANQFTEISLTHFRGNNIHRDELLTAFKQLEAYGWLQSMPGPRADSPPRYKVNQVCHERFEKRAAESKERQELARKAIAAAKSGRGSQA